MLQGVRGDRALWHYIMKAGEVMAGTSPFANPGVQTGKIDGASLSVDKSASASPGFLTQCKDAFKNVWSEISWRLVGDKYADQAIAKFANSLSINSGQIEALQQRLEAGTFIDKAKAGYSHADHALPLDTLKAPIGVIFSKASAQADRVFEGIEREITRIFRYDERVCDPDTGRLKKDIITLLQDAPLLDLSPAQKKGLLDIYNKLLPQAERELAGIVNSADSAINSLDPMKGLLAKDREFLKDSKLYQYQPNEKVGQGEVDRVRAFYESGREGVLTDLSGKLTEAAKNGSAEQIAVATAEAQTKLEALQKKAEGVLDLLEKSVDVPKVAAERSKSLGLDKDEPITLVSTNEKGERVTTQFSPHVSSKIRDLWEVTVEGAIGEINSQRARFLGADWTDAKVLEAAAKELETAVAKVSTQQAQAEALIKAAGKTLSPFAVMSEEKGHENETALKRFIVGLRDEVRQPADDVYHTFKSSTEAAVIKAFGLIEYGTNAVVQAVENAAWRTHVLSGAFQGMVSAPSAAAHVATVATQVKDNLEQVEGSVRETPAIHGSPFVKTFVEGRIAEAAQTFRSALEAEAGKEKAEERFANPSDIANRAESLRITDLDLQRAERIAGVLSVTPEAEQEAFSKVLFAQLFPAKKVEAPMTPDQGQQAVA